MWPSYLPRLLVGTDGIFHLPSRLQIIIRWGICARDPSRLILWLLEKRAAKMILLELNSSPERSRGR
jgi:hypothetical protein